MISKEQFVDTIDSIRIQLAIDKKNSDILNEAFNVHEDFHSSESLVNTIVKLLNLWFPPIDGHCEILFYIISGFGKIGMEGEYESPSELYDRLIKTK